MGYAIGKGAYKNSATGTKELMNAIMGPVIIIIII